MDPSAEPLYKLTPSTRKTWDKPKPRPSCSKSEVNPKTTSAGIDGNLLPEQKEYAAAIPFFEKVKQTEPLNVNNLMNLSCQFELEQYGAAKQQPDGAEHRAQQRTPSPTPNTSPSNWKRRCRWVSEKAIGIRDDDRDYGYQLSINKMEDYQEMITYAVNGMNMTA